MKAAIFHGPGGSWPEKPMTIEEVPTPRPGPGEVLVKIAACGVCGTDLEYLKVKGSTPKRPPLILGHEPSGVVAEIGEEVTNLQPGERVLVATASPCLSCDSCLNGRENLCPNMVLVGANRDGAFAEYMVAPASGTFPLPEGLPLEESAIITDAVATSYRAIYHRAQIKKGDTVVIYGASGGLGLICVQLAAALGAIVIGIGRKKWKLEQAKELGASKIICMEETPDWARTIRGATGGGAQISIDVSGQARMIECAFRNTRPGGKIVVPGFSFQKVKLSVNRLMWHDLSLMGSKNYNLSDLSESIELVRNGSLDIHKVVSHRFALEDVNEAYQMLAKGDMLRGIVVP
ncbi:MAG: alcohol dehydrogenase catalytic domain-containing protein [Proteobacteria bacterium]|nr:alcohol dehydrogenase catalytic domain-containing protein [Pseudomonadota bacterium]